MHTSFFVGCDPDTKNQAYAIVDRNSNLLKVWTIKGGSEFESSVNHINCQDLNYLMGNFHATVEGQEVYRGDVKSNPKDLIYLSRFSGIASMWLASNTKCTRLEIATPKVWKGQKKKHAHQADILWKVGIEHQTLGTGDGRYTIPREKNLYGLTATQWKHVVDAIGLALYTKDKTLWAEKKESTLNN